MLEKQNPTTLSWVLLLCLVVMWGSSFAATKISVQSLSPEWVVALRLTIGALFALPIALMLGQFPKAFLKDSGRYIFLALCATILPFFLISWGTQHISSALAGIIMAIVPINILIGAHFFLKDEKMTIKSIISVILSLIGVAIVIRVDTIVLADFLQSKALIAQVAIIAATLCYAASSIYSRKFSKTTPIEKTIGMLTYGAILSCAYAFYSDPTGWQLGTVSAYLSVSFLGIFPTAVAALMLFYLLDKVGTHFVAYTNFLIPVYATVFGFFALGEAFSYHAIIGLTIIIFGIYVSQSQNKKTK